MTPSKCQIIDTEFYLFLFFFTFVCIGSDAQNTIPVTKNRKDEFGPGKIVVKLDPLTRLAICLCHRFRKKL
jgi:hypothetical protein